MSSGNETDGAPERPAPTSPLKRELTAGAAAKPKVSLVNPHAKASKPGLAFGAVRSSLAQVTLICSGLFICGLIIWLFDDPWLHLAVGLGCTALYGLIGIFSRWHRGQGADRYIDSCYYLGFMITQVALVTSFLKMYQRGASEFKAEVFVSLIAASLGASVLGLLIKIVLDQISTSQDQEDQQVREALADAAKQITASTKTVIEDFASLSAKMTSQVQAINQVMSTSRDTVDLAQRHHTTMNSALTELNSSVEKLRDQLASTGDRAAQAIGGMSGDLKQSIKLMADLRATIQTIDRASQAAVKSLEGVAGAFDGVSKIAPRTEERLDAEVNRLSLQLQNVAGQLNARGEDEMRRLGESANQQIQRSLESITASLEGNLPKLQSIIERFQASIHELNRA